MKQLFIELNGLLGLDLNERDHESGDFDAFLRDVSRRIIESVEDEGYPFDKDATLELIALLGGGGENSVSRFVSDLAEILFLKREQRTEYVTNKEAAPPYKIGKLLLEYAVKSRRIDEIVGILTKGYCAQVCDRLPVGCCSILGYDLGLVPDVMLRAQEIEARRWGWAQPSFEDKCKYHTESGCTIAFFKSPACVGYLCLALDGMLREKYSADKLDVFLEALAVFRNCDIDRSKVFEAMDAVIEKGRALVRVGF